MHNFEAFEAFHPTSHLNVPGEKFAPDLRLCLHPLRLLLQLLQVVLQVPLGHELLDHEVAFAVPGCEGKQLDQIGMVESFHRLDLVEKLFQDFLALFFIVGLQLLGCYLQIASELGLVHIPELSGPNLCTCTLYKVGIL